jgi:hypothetical protein
MIDNDAYLMLTIFQKVLQPDGYGDSDVDEFEAQHKREITEAGQVLVYLGLARFNADSELGWQPTHRLMNIVAECLSNRKHQQEFTDDELTYFLLRDAVFGAKAEGLRGDFAFRLLRQLGLMQINDTGDWVATRQLRGLFAAGYHKRHLEKAVARQQRPTKMSEPKTVRPKPKPVAAMH